MINQKIAYCWSDQHINHDIIIRHIPAHYYEISDRPAKSIGLAQKAIEYKISAVKVRLRC